ncbi:MULTISPECIES: hypothetical protein [Bombella]|uniref:Uncharacterized protein n=1 Tax=Bombella pollinis TaxID=2967337 RepID=A0ABT3WLP5_9PROT|nr:MULTISPECIES: hypothetical protein [Bombella]MCT6855873.1 hypothetical protein [Bombella apis]MCX5619956.1 hypothetical protein [Bombella pollinis]MUG05147.1 hypothetical protein [Bombella sp. ESL0378]MUG90694.1 hypothetical protein [Bombella sp. ESL0385]
MQRSVVSSCSGAVGDRLQDFMTDMRALAAGAAALSSQVQHDERGEALRTASYKRDKLIYQQSREIGMGIAAMVACSIDSMT